MLKATNQYHFVSAPRAATGPGHAAVIAVGGAAAVFDLRTLGPATYDAASADTSQADGAVGNYITVLADGADLGVIFGETKAEVTGANVPLIGQAGTVDADGMYTPHVKECFVIKSGTSQQFLLRDGQDVFMGFVGSGAGFMRLYQSSPPGI